MTWQAAMALLSAAGGFMALWSLWAYRNANGKGGAAGCAKNTESFWSRILYFRNEIVEAAMYAVILGLVAAPYVFPQFTGLTFFFLLFATGLLFLDALFTIWIETVVWRTRCPARIGSAAVNASLFLMVIYFFV